MKKHFNIPVFITHSGCKNNCVFCNQRIITGRPEGQNDESIRETIEKYIGCARTFADVEIAFFGGSFTNLDSARMTALLDIANEYMAQNKFISGIRVSTRPDCITHEIIGILLKYSVTSIELGVQSLFDDVLEACRRGHTAEDTERACEIIKSAGINLTGQMMLGLPRSSREKDTATAAGLAGLGVDCARVYPAAVLPETELCAMFRRGEYAPLDLAEAVHRAKEAKKIFDLNNIKILRMGLCSSDIDPASVVAGAYHPAFGELAEGEIIYDMLSDEIDKICAPSVTIFANKKNMSKIVGHNCRNINRLREKCNVAVIEDDGVAELYKIKDSGGE